MSMKTRPKAIYITGIVALLIVIALILAIYISSPSRSVETFDKPIDYLKPYNDIFEKYPELEYGVNRYGKIIYLDPDAALEKTQEIGKDVIEKVKEQSNYDSSGEFNYTFIPDDIEVLSLYYELSESGQYTAEEEHILAFISISGDILENGYRSSYKFGWLPYITLK